MRIRMTCACIVAGRMRKPGETLVVDDALAAAGGDPSAITRTDALAVLLCGEGVRVEHDAVRPRYMTRMAHG